MYFIDALYGKFDLDISKELFSSPELQRLREIRLCNINSPFITGGTSLNRFEHAIGTAYLAQEIIKFHTVHKNEREAFIIAALLHDVVTAPFGHSLEYLFESIKNVNYEHANIWRMIFSGKTIPSSRYFFCGRKAVLHTLFKHDKVEMIQNILEGKHALSSLLVNEIDIDNIDNVFRFAFHIGIPFNKEIPLQLARSLKYKDAILSVNSKALRFFEEWFNIRNNLYKYLLEDKGEFVAKALLERCLIECYKEDLLSEYDWVLTDAEMYKHILKEGNKTAQKYIQKLMLMEFPEFREIYYSINYGKIDSLLKNKKIQIIEDAFQGGVLLHFIRDVNKTKRPLKTSSIEVSSYKETLIGYAEDRYLIGMFSDTSSNIKKTLSYLENTFNLELHKLNGKDTNEKQISIF
ncbi:MAG: HD domain-containing protein [Thermodesulfovibrionales bacterium]|jgi:hypothetical protein